MMNAYNADLVSPTPIRVNKRIEERVWLMHVLRLTMSECRLHKLLNCNRHANVEKNVQSDWCLTHLLHTCYEVAIND
jgi:hypothetical protein